MDFAVIALTAILVSIMTFFSGFGLGTLLMPAFALFVPMEYAIAATAIVHFLNNILKGALVYKFAHWQTVMRFSLPAVLFAFLGALALNFLSGEHIIFSYSLFEKDIQVSSIKFVIGILMILFAWIELDSRFEKMSIDKKYLPLGGAISGFFGGLSGHQGALRAAFLTKANLDKEQFVGTSVMSALLVDASRLAVYGYFFLISDFELLAESNVGNLIIVGALFAFAGTVIGKRLLKKVTMRKIQLLVGVLLLLLGLSFIFGVI